MVIFVSRLSEVKRLIDEIGVLASNLAVLTSDDQLNLLGQAPVNQAQVLITTQQMLEKRLSGGSFAELEAFHYIGRPRILRLWDETFLPGHPITLNVNELGALFAPLSYVSTPLYEATKQLFDAILEMTSGMTLTLPDFREEYNVMLSDIQPKLAKPDQIEVATKLWSLSGQTVSVVQDGALGQTLVSFQETLPRDLAPLVILDASGRVRNTYRDLELNRKTLVRLKSAVKRYEPLKVHLWPIGGGKKSWSQHRQVLVDGVVQTILKKPDERWLLVSHKSDALVGDVEKDIRARLGPHQEKVSFLTWGNHSASNKFQDVPNVILAGTLFMRTSQYEALKRLSSGRTAKDGHVSRDELEQIRMGEHQHQLLQALCRGSVRKSSGHFCHPMDAYVIASPRSGIEDVIQNTFPGCNIMSWEPIQRTLKGKVKSTVEYLKQWLEKGEESIGFPTVSKAIGMKSSDFTKDVRRHKDFENAIGELGLLEDGPGLRKTRFRRVTAFFGDA